MHTGTQMKYVSRNRRVPGARAGADGSCLLMRYAVDAVHREFCCIRSMRTMHKCRGEGMKRRRRKKHLLNMVFSFWVTLIGVLLAGMSAFFIYHAVTGGGRGPDKPQEEPAAETLVSQKGGTGEEPQENLPPEGSAMPEGAGQEVQGTGEEEQVEEPKGKYADILADAGYMQENHIYAKETAEEGKVTLAFAGDILFDPGYSIMAKILQRANGIHDSISEDLMAEMQNADIFMVNNEFPYSDRGAPTPEKQFTFRAKPEYAELLHEMGADIVSLANNHAYDYGEEAFLDTMDILENTGIPFVGAGHNLEEASAPVYFIAGDIKIAIVSATQIERLDNPDTKGATETTPGVFRCWNPDKLLETVRLAKENSDFVIVYIHWGTESTDVLDWAQLDQAPKIAEAGADLIIGDHSHCLQPVQYVKGVPVVYSLGNFLFNSRQLDTCLVKAVVNESGLESLQFLPALQKNCSTSMLYGEEKERVLAYMRSISPNIVIDSEGYILQN